MKQRSKRLLSILLSFVMVLGLVPGMSLTAYPTYCRKHRTFRFDTLYEEGQYEIFAVVTISVTPGKARYINLRALQSMDRETRKDALASLKRANSYVSTAEVGEEGQILLLITCVGDDDERLVVAAVRMKEIEKRQNRPCGSVCFIAAPAGRLSGRILLLISRPVRRRPLWKEAFFARALPASQICLQHGLRLRLFF